jgi:hypothetical protein
MREGVHRARAHRFLRLRRHRVGIGEDELRPHEALRLAARREAVERRDRRA